MGTIILCFWTTCDFGKNVSMNTQSLFRMTVAIVIIAAILYFFNPLEYITPLLNAAPLIIGLSLLVIAISMALNAFAYHRLLRENSKLRYKTVLSSVFFAWAAESLLPGKLGSFSVAWIWKNNGIALARGLSIVLVYRIVVGLITLFLAIVGIVFIFPQISVPVAIVAGILFMAIAGYFLLVSSLLPRLVNTVFPSLREHTQTALTDMRKTISNPIQVSGLVVNALIQLLIASLFFQWMFASAGISVSYEFVVAASSIVQIASLLPISINGLGIREGLTGVLFGFAGVPPALAIGVSAINTAVGYVITFIISALWAGKWVREAQKKN